jgi:CHAT domain-containing protein/Flp pilus assembly protein TadD
MEMPDDFEEKLERLKAAGGSRPRPDCPAETEWLRLAAGLLPDPQAGKLLAHSAECDACAILLRQATEDFAEEVRDGEVEQIRALKSAQPAWQRAMAQRLATQAHEPLPVTKVVPIPSPQPRPVVPFVWAYAAAAAVLLVAGAATVQMLRQPSVDQLIATAYTEQRPFEMRIAGAARAEVRQQRGPGDLPAAFSAADYRLKERLKAHPDEEESLAASGRLKLLSGDYEEAIRKLGRLVDARPDSPELLTDLASAYFQRGKTSDDAKDIGQAIDYLGRALAKRPDDPVSLFNRAIANEEMGMFHEAVRDWEHYLKVDPAGAWADEARQRLNDLRARMKEREKPLGSLHTDPVKAAPLLHKRAATDTMPPEIPWAPALDEEYLQIAVTDWLPSLYAASGAAASGGGAVRPRQWRRDAATWEALNALAHVARGHHGDQWLTDLLWGLPAESAPPDRVAQFAAVFDLLARAARANAAGDPDTARPLAESAARSFRNLGSTPGELRAREEVLYGMVRGDRDHLCIGTAARQLREPALASYRWLETQATLWQATCAYATTDLEAAQRFSESALQLTRRSGYAGQRQRSVLFAAGFLRSTERNWRDTHAGLRQFWAEWHNPFGAYESCLEMAILAADAGRAHLAHLLRREALRMIEQTPDLSYRAAARYRVAVAAFHTGNLAEAEKEFQNANREFAALPPTPANLRQLAASEVDLATVELRRGRLDSATAQLQRAAQRSLNGEDWVVFTYHQTRGQVLLRRGQTTDAEAALLEAVRIGESYLRNLEEDSDRLAWERDTQRTYRGLVALYAQKPETTPLALDVWEWYRGSALRASAGSNARAGPVIPSVAGVLPSLKQETILSFAVLPSGVVAWSFDDRGVSFSRVSMREEELARRVKRMAHLCADADSDLARLREEARGLYDALVAPLEKQLDPARTLIIEPDLFLSEVPWPALMDSRGEYLGARYALVISPGLRYMQNLRPSAKVSADQPILVAGAAALPPELASRFLPLPGAEREARDVAASFRLRQMLFGTQVTAAAIREGLARSAVFHFAGHAVAGANQSGLVLASASLTGSNNGPRNSTQEVELLSGSDLEPKGLQRLQLVVLSACATAETEKGFGEPDTLVRTFLRAGVPHVVASRWPVDSQKTAEAMAQFYSRLLNGQPPALAMRETTAAVGSRSETAHPYFWAAFGVYGR